jgi:hypothetical protein
MSLAPAHSRGSAVSPDWPKNPHPFSVAEHQASPVAELELKEAAPHHEGAGDHLPRCSARPDRAPSSTWRDHQGDRTQPRTHARSTAQQPRTEADPDGAALSGRLRSNTPPAAEWCARVPATWCTPCARSRSCSGDPRPWAWSASTALNGFTDSTSNGSKTSLGSFLRPQHSTSFRIRSVAEFATLCGGGRVWPHADLSALPTERRHT